MNQSFELRNSLWRNAVLFALCLGLFVPGLLLQMWQIWYGLILFGGGTILFGYRTFDRRVKVVIDERGIQDFRSRKYGLVPWGDVASFEFTNVKGNYYLYYFPRDPSKFHQPSSKVGKWLDKKIKFRVQVSLQNMSVDIGGLSMFMKKMIAAHSSVQLPVNQVSA
ncbi:STM3941 family protein [Dyella flagellata]|nr:STM3941 family protein [Dyella flagellata]